MQAVLDLANIWLFVHLVERTTSIGGKMSQLDKTFPTNDCSACILSPKLVECGRHFNINLLTLSDRVYSGIVLTCGKAFSIELAKRHLSLLQFSLSVNS